MFATVILGAAFVSGTVLLVLACYFLMRQLEDKDPSSNTRDLANSVMLRISALHGLILALVFAQEMAEYQQLKLESAIETNALADIYFDAGRFGGNNPGLITTPIRNYAQIVIEEEWDSLGATGLLASRAWGQWDAAYNEILDLIPATDRQRSLRDHMLNRIHSIAETRVKREHHARNSLSLIFWFAAVSGVIFMGLAFYPYLPRRSNLVLLALLGGFTGIILFFIYAFSNPFQDPGSWRPDDFRQVLRQFQHSTDGAPGARGTM